MTPAARDLASAYLGLAVAVARRFARGKPRWLIDELDLEAEAVLALCEAAARFDPARNADSANHLRWRLRNHLVDVLRVRGAACRGGRRRLPPGPLTWEVLEMRPGREPDPAASAEVRLDAPVYRDRLAGAARPLVERVVLGGERVSDVARDLGRPAPSVWSQVSRELARIRTELETHP